MLPLLEKIKALGQPKPLQHPNASPPKTKLAKNAGSYGVHQMYPNAGKSEKVK
ncbi:MAG: hypothetical protein AAB932_02845 [Patescibacteria group bacterium]